MLFYLFIYSSHLSHICIRIIKIINDKKNQERIEVPIKITLPKVQVLSGMLIKTDFNNKIKIKYFNIFTIQNKIDLYNFDTIIEIFQHPIKYYKNNFFSIISSFHLGFYINNSK